ncbi:MAG: DUF4926 domain-containing protein [Phormidesmis sp.]
MRYSLFSQVALTEDIPEYNLKKGDIATVVEHYPMPGEEDGYSLEGLDVPHVTVEVPESKITAVGLIGSETVTSIASTASKLDEDQKSTYLQ